MTRNKTIEELLGGVAKLDKTTKTVVINLDELDPYGKINTGEGFVLALIKKLGEHQGTEVGRALEVSKTTPFMTLRNAVNVKGTAVNLRFFSSDPIADLDIDEV